MLNHSKAWLCKNIEINNILANVDVAFEKINIFSYFYSRYKGQTMQGVSKEVFHCYQRIYPHFYIKMNG
jgi:hypothetical protein